MEPASPAPPTDPTRPVQPTPAPEASTDHPATDPEAPTADQGGAAAPEGTTGGARASEASPGRGAREDTAQAGGVREGAATPRLARGQERSPRDMVMSLAVLLVPIALLLIFYRVVLSGDAPVTVDPSATLQEAREAAVFTVLEPRGLGNDWHVSTATFSREAAGATLRLGYVDPDKDPVQLVESSVPAATLLPAELGDSAEALGNFRTEAGVWRVYDGRPGEKAIVLAEPARTIVVVGRTNLKNLQTLASSLS